MRGGRSPDRFHASLLSFGEKRAERELREQEEALEIRLPRIGRLRTAGDVAQYQAKLIRRTERKEVDTTKAWKLAQMASMLVKSIQVGELERRIESLELRQKAAEDGENERGYTGEGPPTDIEADVFPSGGADSHKNGGTVNTSVNGEGGIL